MFFVSEQTKLGIKYGPDAPAVQAAVAALGQLVPVDGMSRDQIRNRISQLPPGPVCLIGGYDLIPAFLYNNPTWGMPLDDDQFVYSDGPYGASPAIPGEGYLPSRPVSRIPDEVPANAEAFLALLERQRLAPTTATPGGSFEQAAKEFEGSLGEVHKAIPGAMQPVWLSHPENMGNPALPARLTQKGRIHIMLHGSSKPALWEKLWGNDAGTGLPTVPGLSAGLIGDCDLNGAVVVYSSCYSAMLDPPRHAGNQVALASLRAGAKVVYGFTRANWIDNLAPYNGFGTRLVTELWHLLQQGVPAAQALLVAKRQFAEAAMSTLPGVEKYVKKTVLQAQCYGHPNATLNAPPP